MGTRRATAVAPEAPKRGLLPAIDQGKSWGQILRFKDITFQTGGKFKACFCDYETLAAGKYCKTASTTRSRSEQSTFPGSLAWSRRASSSAVRASSSSTMACAVTPEQHRRAPSRQSQLRPSRKRLLRRRRLSMQHCRHSACTARRRRLATTRFATSDATRTLLSVGHFQLVLPLLRRGRVSLRRTALTQI